MHVHVYGSPAPPAAMTPLFVSLQSIPELKSQFCMTTSPTIFFFERYVVSVPLIYKFLIYVPNVESNWFRNILQLKVGQIQLHCCCTTGSTDVYYCLHELDKSSFIYGCCTTGSTDVFFPFTEYLLKETKREYTDTTANELNIQQLNIYIVVLI